MGDGRNTTNYQRKETLAFAKTGEGSLCCLSLAVFSRVILDSISEAFDPLLRKEQAGFRKGKSCGDHIFTLRQILEQCQEWNTPFYANFDDYETAFNSIQRISLAYTPARWNPPKIVSIIKLLYGDFRTKVICGQYLREDFEIKTGVKQGCILSPLPLLPRDRLGHEGNSTRRQKRHQMDLHRNIR